MKTKIYQVYKNLNLNIVEIECVRTTEDSYWIREKGMRSALNTNYVKSFDNKEDAVNYLKHLLTSKIRSLESTVEYYQKELTKFNSMYL